MRSPALIAISSPLLLDSAPAAARASCLLGVQRPEIGESLERGIALHGMEALGRVLLVAGLELRDAEQQSRLALAAQPALGDALGDLLDRLVVLPVPEIREAEAHVLRPGGGGVGLLRDPRQACPVGRRGLLRALQQPLVRSEERRVGKEWGCLW